MRNGTGVHEEHSLYKRTFLLQLVGAKKVFRIKGIIPCHFLDI